MNNNYSRLKCQYETLPDASIVLVNEVFPSFQESKRYSVPLSLKESGVVIACVDPSIQFRVIGKFPDGYSRPSIVIDELWGFILNETLTLSIRLKISVIPFAIWGC
jgi:hypothetical protein